MVSCPLYSFNLDSEPDKCIELAEESSEKEIELKENKAEFYANTNQLICNSALNQHFEIFIEVKPESINQKVVTPPPEV